MDVLKHKRELEEYRRHKERVRSQRPLIDTTTPHSLGLKHLATRPKKQQLIEDRRQSVANENAKLMERMAKIMSSHQEEERFARVAGRNEAFRRREIDRINAENRSIVDRLQMVPPMLSAKQLEDDFQHHVKDVKKIMTRTPAMRSAKHDDPDSALYLPQVDAAAAAAAAARNALQGNNTDEFGSRTAAISSIGDFRRQVIATKKVENKLSSTGLQSASSDPYSLFHGQR
jgi:hypothetical protein